VKVIYSWLKDFVTIKIPPKLLADKLTMAGLEVTSLEEKGGDFVFEIEITSNRPDWLSIIGVAREVAAITGVAFKMPALPSIKPKKSLQEKLEIIIENKSDCSFYAGKIIRNVNIVPTPELMRIRLELLGCRPVNNIVDITNYSLFEMGEPLHAFDLDKISGSKIMVRRARSGEKITVIDGQQKILSPEVLIIADSRGPVAIAGVMGGKDTEVSITTKNILLEAAVFDPALIRRGRRVLGLQSESSYRFERGLDSETALNASLRAAELIGDISGGEITLAKVSGGSKGKNMSVTLAMDSVERVLGVKINPPKIRKILTALGFTVKSRGAKTLQIAIPPFRKDVALDVDLIEEIARIYGYENIPTTFPAVKPQISVGGTRALVSEIKNILRGLGLSEVITYSLIDRNQLKELDTESGLIEIQNPLSREQEVLRPDLLPGLLKCIATNINQKQEYVNIFEIANLFRQEGREPREELYLGLAVCGVRSSLYPGHGIVREELGVLNLKGVIEIFFSRLGITNYSFVPSGNGITIKINEEAAGSIQEVKRGVLERFEVKNKSASVARISLDKVLIRASMQKKFVPLPKFPSISRDISIILPEQVLSDKIVSLILSKGAPLIQEVKITDYYKGKQIPAGFLGLTVSCLYRALDRTLTENEVSPVHGLVCESLKNVLQAKIRA